MTLARRIALLALAVLLAPRAEASRTSVWGSNPHATLVAARTQASSALASLASTDAELVESPLFDLGDLVLVEREPDHEDHFGLGPLDLLGPSLLRGPPESYPETRVGGLELLPPFRVGAEPALSLWSRQACGSFSCGLASDGREDPLGLSEQTPEMRDQQCRVTGTGCAAQHNLNEIWEEQYVQGSVEAIGGAVQLGLGAAALASPDPFTKAMAVLAIARGADHMAAGWRSVWSRQPKQTFSGEALRSHLGGWGTAIEVVADLGSTGVSAKSAGAKAGATPVADVVVGPATPLNPRAYSVLYETEIPESVLKEPNRYLHNTAANEKLLADMNSDARFSAVIKEAVPDVMKIQGKTKVLGGSPGKEVTWHHVPKSNRMQLVWRYQHEKSTAKGAWNEVWDRLFHPEKTGGYADAQGKK